MVSHSVTGAIPDVTKSITPDAALQATDDGTTPANADGAGQPEESNDSSGTINWEELESNADATADVNLNLDKVHGIPGNSKHAEPDSPHELIRKHQWMDGWHFSDETISFAEGLGHLKHVVKAIESEELKAHLKTTGILFKGVQYELSKLNDKVGGIQQNVDSSLGGMITKTQAATILSNQKDLQNSQELLQTKMEAMESKLDLLLSFLLVDDAKKGEKTLVTKCGPELQAFAEDKEGGGEGGSRSGKGKAVVTSTAAVQTTGPVAGSSKEVGGSSGHQRQHQILMDPTLMLDPDTISKKFTQEIEIGGVTERVFYRDPRLQQADEKMARLLNLEINPDYNLEESLEEQRRLERKKILKDKRGKGRGRGRGRTQSKTIKPIEKGISIREPDEQSRSSLSSKPSVSIDRKGKGILLEEPKKSKDSSSYQIPLSVQSTPVEEEEKKKAEEEEEKKSVEIVESETQAKPEGLNPDEGTRSNPDELSALIPDESNTDGDTNVNPDAHDSEELYPEQEDEKKKASRLKKYVYLNKVLEDEEMREVIYEALKRYIYNIKMFKDRWRKPIPADKDVDRRRNFPPLPRRESKFTPDYKMEIKFIPETGVVQGQQEFRIYKYSWAEMADRELAVQEDFKTFGLGHPDFQKNSRLPQLKDSAPLNRRVDESLSQEHLDRLMSVSLIMDQMDGNEDKEKMIYFLEDGLNYKLNEIELMQKNWKELEHVQVHVQSKECCLQQVEEKNGIHCCISEKVYTGQCRIQAQIPGCLL